MEKENRSLIEEKSKIDVEYKITLDRYNETKRKLEETRTEYSNSKSRDSEHISSLESRFNQTRESYDILKAENKAFKISDERMKFEVINLKNDKERFEEKYLKAKTAKDELMKKCANLENQLTNLTFEKEYFIMEKKKHEEEKRIRQDIKNQCIDQMKHSISNFKSDLMKSRSKSKGH